MSRLSKRLGEVSLTAFAIGFASVCGGATIPVVLSVGIPVGAIFLGLFLVAYIFEGEMAKFDAEERSRLALAQRCAPAPSDPQLVTAPPKSIAATLAASSR